MPTSPTPPSHYNFESSNHSVYGMNWTGTTPTYIVQTSTTNATRENTYSHSWVGNAYLQYTHTWADAHNFSAMVGVNGEQFKSDNFYARRTQLYDENYPQLNLAYGDMAKAIISSATGDRSTAGWFGRINYDYKGIYLLELNGRYDGSSRFPTATSGPSSPPAPSATALQKSLTGRICTSTSTMVSCACRTAKSATRPSATTCS